MPKARKTKASKPQPKPKVEAKAKANTKGKVKRKALRNIDNEEVKSKRGNRVGAKSKNSQEQVVEKKRQPRRSARQKTNYEEVDLSIESCLKEAQIDFQVSSPAESLNVSSPNPASASESPSPDRATESKASKTNEIVKLARPLDLEFAEMRDWRSSSAMDY